MADPCRWRSPIAAIPACVCFRAQRQAVADPMQPDDRPLWGIQIRS